MKVKVICLSTSMVLFSIIVGMMIMLNSCSIMSNTTGTTYYISSSSGSDNNVGTKENKPWKTFEKLNKMILTEGDKVLLKRGDTWNERLTITGGGSDKNWVTIAAYGEKGNPLPKISLNNLRDDICMVITDVLFEGEQPKFTSLKNIIVEHIELTNANVGLYIRPIVKNDNNGLIIRNCLFTDIWCDKMLKMMGHGYTLEKYIALKNEPQGNLPISDSLNNVNKTGGGGGEWTFSTGLLLSGKDFNNVNIYNLVFENSITGVEGRHLNKGSIHNIVSTGCWAGVFRIIDCDNFDVYNNRLLGGSEKYTFFGGTCGGFVGACKDVTIRNNEFAYEYSHGENDGCGFDFEVQCENTSFKNNVNHHNESGAMLIMQLIGKQHVDVRVDDNLFYSNILKPKHYGYIYDIYYYNTGTDNLFLTNNYFYTRDSVRTASEVNGDPKTSKGFKTYFYGNASNTELNLVDINNSKKNITEYRNRFSFNKDGNLEGFSALEGTLTNKNGSAILTAKNGKGRMFLNTPINGFVYNTVFLNVTKTDGGTVYCQYKTYEGIKTTKEIEVKDPGKYTISLSDRMIDSDYRNFTIFYKPKNQDGKIEFDTVEFLTDINVTAEKLGENKIRLTFGGNCFPVLALEVLKENFSIKGYSITNVQKKKYNTLEVIVPEKVGSLKGLEVTVKGDLFIEYFQDLINGIDCERTAEDDATLLEADKEDFYYKGALTLHAL